MKIAKGLFPLGLILCHAVTGFAADAVRAKVDLLDVIRSGAVEYHINPKEDPHDAPTDIWKIQADGTLKVSGRGYGYVATNEVYRDYHLVLEL